jgi:hypothetical protein
MNAGELKALLINVPDTAEVYVMSDHGQSPEQAGSLDATMDAELSFYGDEVDWDEEVDACDITAVRIS